MSRGDHKARLWKVVQIDDQTEKMKTGLKNIVDTFGETVWKGI